MTDRPHRSIGEVLHLLESEFPEVTISKIRFLESQGLLNPERTPSGYRMFFDADVARLRWILVQQRDNFLPLRVIKKRLDSGDWDPNEIEPIASGEPTPESTTFSRVVDPVATESTSGSAAVEPAAAAPVDDTPQVVQLTAAAPLAEAVLSATEPSRNGVEAVDEDSTYLGFEEEAPHAPVTAPSAEPVAEVPASVAEAAPTPAAPAASVPAAPAPATSASAPPTPVPAAVVPTVASVAAATEPAAGGPASEPQPASVQPPQVDDERPAAAAAMEQAALADAMLPATPHQPLHPVEPEPAPEPEPENAAALAGSQGEIAFSITELAEAASLEVADLRELQRFGIIEAINDDQVPFFDADALMVARASAAFMSHGLEPRHLKAWKVAAEREAGVLEQLTLPVAKQNSAGASRRALELANDLVSMGSDLRYAMLRRALRQSLKFD